MTETKERRRAPRTSLESAYTEISESTSQVRGKIQDISLLGVKFLSEKEFLKDATIELGLLLPNFRSLIDISGRVVWCSKKDQEGFATGVEFQDERYKNVLVEEYIHYMKSRENHYTMEQIQSKGFFPCRS